MSDITPQFPADIPADAKHVEFRAEQCRECGTIGPWVNWGDKMTDPNGMWGHEHMAATGHKGDIYLFTMTRNTGKNMVLRSRV